MSEYFEGAQNWDEMQPGVFVRDGHRYPNNGGGAAVFRMKAGSTMAKHDHPTGEHGYIVSGMGEFGGKRLEAGDMFWMNPGETHDVIAITDLVFFAVSLPRS